MNAEELNISEYSGDNFRSEEHKSSPSPEREQVRRRHGRGRGSRGGRARGGRGRGGRGRRGRGGGQVPNQPKRAEVAAIIREERDRQLKERITMLSQERKDAILFKACEKYPSFALDVTNDCSNQVRQTDQGHHPPPEAGVPSWCTCSRCREMPTEAERVCCNQVPDICFSTLPDFGLIAQDNLVLAINQRYREDVFAYAQDEDFNRGRRHATYRHFILWHHGYLGAGNRRVIPSCCVWKIRDKFPDNFGQYRDFVGGRLG